MVVPLMTNMLNKIIGLNLAFVVILLAIIGNYTADNNRMIKVQNCYMLNQPDQQAFDECLSDD